MGFGVLREDLGASNCFDERSNEVRVLNAIDFNAARDVDPPG